MQKVTAAVIEKDGKVLIAKRKTGTRLEGKWEFPGGKLECSETPEECLRRELEEELGIDTVVGEFICSSEYEYPHISIELLVYRVKYISGEFKLTDHDEIKWVYPHELANYNLASADIPVVNKLMADIYDSTNS
ncbi:MAG: NUDIX hydrolase [Candidatus Melainabacteria bacterium GWF2_32_7]|nr:MAG: NUDIX hydrolase [Candidatus Melainabacteria bacterium GWF2_32_7]